MYALYAHREGMTNIFIRTFPRLSMMGSSTIEMGSGSYSDEFHSFPEGYEPFALNLRTGDLLWFVDNPWVLVEDEEIRQSFFSSFSCFD